MNTYKIPAIFRQPFDDTNIETRYKSVGLNTGNQVFTDSLRKILGANICTFNDLVWHSETLPDIGNVVTTDLIWITANANFDYIHSQLNHIGDRAIVPISVGIQAPSLDTDFKLNDSTLSALKALEERAVIGVRGHYTASILEKHGIKNIDVIGCPSLYYWNDENFKMNTPEIKKVERGLCNFKTMYSALSQKQKHFLSYCAERDFTFIEQTDFPLKPEYANDDAYFNYVSSWLSKKTEVHFTTDAWLSAMENYDFSFGARFHGNVIAMWKNIPALFMTIDSRTQEMIDFFGLPHIKMEDFDKSKSPEYYYELANYENFNSKYNANFNNFKNFLNKNKLSLK